MLIAQFLVALEKLYPLKEQEPWDFSGLMPRSNQYLQKPLRGIVLGLDLNSELLKLALQQKANLIIIHHPFIFSESYQEALEQDAYKRKIWKVVHQNELLVYSLHTNYDQSAQGTSYQIAKHFFPQAQIKKLNKYAFSISFTKELCLADLEKRLLLANWKIENKINLQKLKKIKTLQIYGGAGDSSTIVKFYEAGALVLSSDLKWSQRLSFYENNILIWQISHKIEELILKAWQTKMLELLKKDNYQCAITIYYLPKHFF